MIDIDTRLREDAARWQEHLDARRLPSVAVGTRLRRQSRWLPLTAPAGVATLVAGVAAGAHLLTGSGVDPLTGVRPRPLPTGTAAGGVPTTFLGVYSRGSGDLGERRKLALAMLSTADGRLVRDLAVTMSDTDTRFADPSRGPDGDIWFVRGSRSCGGRIVRIDAGTGRGTVVVTRPGTNVDTPVASPDGRWLAFRESSCPLGVANQLVLRDLFTGRERRILPVDAWGRPGPVPTPTRPQMRRSGISSGAADKTPAAAFYLFAWSPDSSRVAVVHRAARMAGGWASPGIAVLDAATGRQVQRLAAPTGCEYHSAAYDAVGLVLGETCDAGSNSPRSAVVQLGADIRTVLSRHRLTPCAAYPKITVSGVRRQALLITTYRLCPGQHSMPMQRVEVLEHGRLRTVHDYVAPGEFLDGATW